MKTVKVDKKVPIPEIGRPCKYPWKTMEVGDSFFVTGAASHAFSGQACMAARRAGRRFTTRSLPNGCRVWRIK